MCRKLGIDYVEKKHFEGKEDKALWGGSAIQDGGDWIEVTKGRRTNPLKQSNLTVYHNLSYLYVTLPEYAADPTDSNMTNIMPTPTTTPPKLNHQCPTLTNKKPRINFSLVNKSVKRTPSSMITSNNTFSGLKTKLRTWQRLNNPLAIEASHHMSKHEQVSSLQNGRNAGYAFSTTIQCTFQCFQQANHVHFHDKHNQLHFFDIDGMPVTT